MAMLETQITCPRCSVLIHVPFMSPLQAKAREDFDLVEISAQKELESLQEWLESASLFSLVRYWLKLRFEGKRK